MINCEERQWQAIGEQAKIAREQLFVLLNLATGNMPKAIVQHIEEAIDSLDTFRCEAENRRFATNPSEALDTSTFYGPII